MSAPTVVFLDRDGTIIEDAHFLADPEGVVLLPGAAAAIRRLNAAGIPAIVVTNQSGIGRGAFTEDDYQRVRERLDARLADEGAHLDATYHCPHSPERDPDCPCRKPRDGMYRAAAREQHLELRAPAFVGDRWRDVAAAGPLGGRGVLVRSPRTTPDDLDRAHAAGVPVAESLGAAIDDLLGAG